MELTEWIEWCSAVQTAAEQLRRLAESAEGDANATVASTDMAPMTGLVHPHRADTHFAMMLGPFAVLEQLRQRISS
ncbi:MAG TPA: hypothetical protein VHU18_03440 [Rhizomicrobium sp.]|jgi:hypothetical protein|nr:hypothetical protein [Rhizomicrobium sp.]